MTEPQRERLISWKEIAGYLGRDMRTVIRWEKERGLPVHRFPGGKSRSVFAYADELDRWVASGVTGMAETPAPGAAVLEEAAPGRRLGGRVVVAAVCILAAGVAFAAVLTSRHTVARAVVDAEGVTAIDAAGRRVWSYRFPAPSVPTTGNGPDVAIGPVDRSARPGAVVSWIAAVSDETGPGTLLALGADGRPRWSRSFTDSLQFGQETFAPPWLPWAVSSLVRANKTVYVWMLHHHTWWPSMLAAVDSDGRLLGRFVNAGWIVSAKASTDGRWIVAGGFSNSRNGAAFALLPFDDIDGASPEDAGSAFACANCPPGRPALYIVIPWSDVAGREMPAERTVAMTPYANGTLELHALQDSQGAEIVVELSPTLDIVRYGVSDAYLRAHRRLEQEGRLAHDVRHCPALQRPQVVEWMPQGGWRTVDVSAVSRLRVTDLK